MGSFLGSAARLPFAPAIALWRRQASLSLLGLFGGFQNMRAASFLFGGSKQDLGAETEALTESQDQQDQKKSYTMGGGEGGEGEEIEVTAMPVNDESLLDPLNSGFTWYRPDVKLDQEQTTSGHTWTISGHDMQILTCSVPPGNEFITEVGSFVFMHPNMTTAVELTLCGSEGCGRICGGESCVKVFLKNPSSEEGYIGVTPNFPAKVLPINFGTDIPADGSLIATGGAYMADLGGVDVGCDLDCGIASCCCSGMGACRQKLTGPDGSVAFLAAGGTIVYRTLTEGETIVIDSGSVLAYDESVELGITPNGRFCTCCLGGEGCCSTTLTGPGQIWMHSMNFQKFKNAVQVTIHEDGDNGMDRGDDAGP